MTPPRSLDTTIAEALAPWIVSGFQEDVDTATAAVRRAVCEWLREDEGAKDAMADERRKHYTKATPDCVCGWKNDRTGHMSNQHRAHAEERVLARLLAYMEGDG